MTGKAGRCQSQPKRRFLGDVDADNLHRTILDQVVAAFGEKILGVFEELRFVGDHPKRAFVVDFFVSRTEKDHVA